MKRGLVQAPSSKLTPQAGTSVEDEFRPPREANLVSYLSREHAVCQGTKLNLSRNGRLKAGGLASWGPPQPGRQRKTYTKSHRTVPASLRSLGAFAILGGHYPPFSAQAASRTRAVRERRQIMRAGTKSSATHSKSEGP